MTNKPEPVVSIGNAASEIARWMADEGVGDEWLLRADVDAILHKHFDSAVTAAVARREAEIVGMLSDIASSQHRQCRECEKHRDEEGANAHEHAYEIICAAVVKIQNGGGA